MEDCIFGKIASGEIQGLRIYENDETLAFMDIAGDVDGHILVIPKKHCKNILDCDTETLSAVANTVKMVSDHLTSIVYICKLMTKHNQRLKFEISLQKVYLYFNKLFTN